MKNVFFMRKVGKYDINIYICINQTMRMNNGSCILISDRELRSHWTNPIEMRPL